MMPVATSRAKQSKLCSNLHSEPFPTGTETIDQVLAEGDRVLVFVTWNGTHDGPLQGYPATGKRIQVRTADLYRITDGQIVEHWDIASPLDLTQQIGLLEFKSAGKR